MPGKLATLAWDEGLFEEDIQEEVEARLTGKGTPRGARAQQTLQPRAATRQRLAVFMEGSSPESVGE